MSTLKNIHDRARQLRQERDRLIEKRRTDANADPMMTPAERAEYVASWRTEYTKIFAPKFAKIREELAEYAEATRRQGAKARPQFDLNSAADLTRTEQAWRNVVLPQLEKGRSLKAALRRADADAVLGAERFAPAWMQANSAGQEASGLAGLQVEVQKLPGRDGGRLVGANKEVDTSVVARTVALRLAELAGSAEDRCAIAYAATLDDVLPATERFIDHLESGQGNSLDVAIGLSLAMNQTDTDSDAESPDAA
ncbi:hypothetical protein [Prescottella equi]|uniref:hypothetical protein n=1 Tax=Rhodococcus hoagii TaxID=43767 RepID=UPI001C74F579|nr:hypothetical protein [Prescottella equi]BCN57126.1 hypothetical protein RE9427_04960 [Prescottella equi]